MSSDEMKRKAAHAALVHLPETGVLGLGTGSTTRWFIEAVGELVRGGRKFSAVPTSNASRTFAEQCSIPLLDDAGPWRIDVCVDGADEVSKNLDLIKGGGGAHTREKIVNFASRLNVIIVDESKLVDNLGQKRRLPIEVLRFGLNTTLAALSALGEPQLRMVPESNSPFLTDSGNHLVDLATGQVGEPGRLDQILRRLPGVVETGLFVARADIVVVAAEDGVRELKRGN
ncbi:MAG TPA: ribose-5-phosphate isomerase RpiA [Polyangiaceae bacterium]|nr:ribose-5-phosphate isomerase RpiA [Polyangiaceae bacterium]